MSSRVPMIAVLRAVHNQVQHLRKESGFRSDIQQTRRGRQECTVGRKYDDTKASADALIVLAMVKDDKRQASDLHI